MSKPVSRRGFLRGSRGGDAPRLPPLPPQRRPPGAVEERAFLGLCTGCGDCVEACPHNAVHTISVTAKLGAKTPVMVPQSRPCHMCEGFPCAQACPEGALVPPTGPTWKLGVVEVDTQTCLPFRGPECGACAGLCPGEVEALTLKRGRPIIDVDACVGCGLCIAGCPTLPQSLHMPMLNAHLINLPPGVAEPGSV